MLKDISYHKSSSGAVYGSATDSYGYTHSYRFFDGEFFPIEECDYRSGFTTQSGDGEMGVSYDLHFPYYDSDSPRVGVVCVEYKTGYVHP